MSSFLHTRSLLVLHAYISTELIDCVLLLLFETTAVLLISSVKTVCFSLLSLCRDFNIICCIVFYKAFMIFYKTDFLH